MSRNTKIQWCDDTINPTSGCNGCELYVPALAAKGIRQPCYAAKIHEQRLARYYREHYGPSFTEVRLIPGRLQECARWSDLTGKPRPDKPWLNGMPRMIFISDLADALSEAVSFEYLRDEIISPVVSWQPRNHIGLWLTKRPQRMAEFAVWLAAQGISWPANLWAGTSVTNMPTAQMRVWKLTQVPAAVRFLSCEPMRGPLQLAEWLGAGAIGWVIAGGESGPESKIFDADWARSLRDQCHAAQVPFFLKQVGARSINTVLATDAAPGPIKDSHGGDWMEWTPDLRVREVPALTPAAA